MKLTQIRDDGKLSFTMKEVDQESGEDLFREKTAMLRRDKEEMVETGAIDYKGNPIKVPKREAGGQ